MDPEDARDASGGSMEDNRVARRNAIVAAADDAALIAAPVGAAEAASESLGTADTSEDLSDMATSTENGGDGTDDDDEEDSDGFSDDDGDEESDSEDEDEDFGFGLPDSVAPEPATDDSGDETTILREEKEDEEAEEKGDEDERGKEAPAATATAFPRPRRKKRHPTEGAGDAGRGGYTTGGAALHPRARAASSHFQAADALACGPAAHFSSSDDESDDGSDDGDRGRKGGEEERDEPDDPLKPKPGEEDVVLVDHAMVSVWRFPARGDGPPKREEGSLSTSTTTNVEETSSSSSSSAAFSGGTKDRGPKSYASPKLLARCSYHEIEPYSVARSSDGRTVAIGGDLGLVAFLRLERCPRSRKKKKRSPSTPAEGEEPCALCAAADAAREATRHREREIRQMTEQVRRQAEWSAAAAAARAAGQPPPPPPPPLAPVALDGEDDGDDGEGERQGGSRNNNSRRHRHRHHCPPSLPAHFRPVAVVTLGSMTAVANNNMINGVRFGLVGGKERLVAAVQDRYVYFVDVPPPPPRPNGGKRRGQQQGNGGGFSGAALRYITPATTPPPPGSGAVAESLRVIDLTDPNDVDDDVDDENDDDEEQGDGTTTTATVPRRRPISQQQRRVAPARTRKLDVYAPPSRDALEVVLDARTRTAVAGPFPRAVNFALPSPDGKSLAVVGDFDGAWVLRARQPAPSARGGGGGANGSNEGGAGTTAGGEPSFSSAPAPSPLSRVRRSASAARLASGLRPHPYDATAALRLPFGVASPPRILYNRFGYSEGDAALAAAPFDRDHALDVERLQRRREETSAGRDRPAQAQAAKSVFVEVGSQYCAWSPDSSLLAATSDALRAAFVWHVPRGQPLLRVEACGRAALAAAFAPGRSFPATLAFAEAARRVYCADLRFGADGFAKLPPLAGFGGGGRGRDGGAEDDGDGDLRLGSRAAEAAEASSSASDSPFPRPLPRVCGFGVTPSGRVLAATRAGLAEWRLSEGWSPSCHADAPPAFRAAARALLCAGAAKESSRSRGGAGPWSLPTDVLLSIVEMAAQPRGAWIGVGSGGGGEVGSNDDGGNSKRVERGIPPSELRKFRIAEQLQARRASRRGGGRGSGGGGGSGSPTNDPLSDEDDSGNLEGEARDAPAAAPRPSGPLAPPCPRPIVRLLAPAGGSTYAAVVAMRNPGGGGGGTGEQSNAAGPLFRR